MAIHRWDGAASAPSRLLFTRRQHEIHHHLDGNTAWNSLERGRIMRFSIFATSLIAALAIPVQLAAHGQQNEERHKPDFIVFDAPNSGAPACAPSGCGTYGYAVNREGTVVGYYLDPDIVSHGFLRSPDGHSTTIDVPGATLTNGLGEGIYAM